MTDVVLSLVSAGLVAVWGWLPAGGRGHAGQRSERDVVCLALLQGFGNLEAVGSRRSKHAHTPGIGREPANSSSGGACSRLSDEK